MVKNTISKMFLFLMLFCFKSGGQSIAQDVEKYRRSSLSLILINNEGLGEQKDLIINSFNNNPFPDKYNRHNINLSNCEINKVKLSTSDYIDNGWYVDTLRTMKEFFSAMKKINNSIRYIKADSSEALLEPNDGQINQMKLDKFVKENELAKKNIATWFNRDPYTGKMDWELIKERGMYSANSEQIEQAETVADQTSFLLDFDLIGNTYSVFNSLSFYPNEPIAASIRDKAKESAIQKFAGKPEILLTKSLALIDSVYERTKEGYTVKCNTYLYKLIWNDDIANKTKLYFFNDNIDSKVAWDTTSIFQMEFLGKVSSSSLVTFKIGEQRTESEIIDLQIKRTVDNALAKLQKEYVQFRPVSPIYSTEPVTAKIGLKEGVEPKQKFEILEMSFNEIGIPEWKNVGNVSVDKNAIIWDNRQGSEIQSDEEGNALPSYTIFSGGKKAISGLHYIRLIK